MQNTLKNFTLTSIKNIQKAIENNKLIIFVGAGVSRNSGIPTWESLVQILANELGIKPNSDNRCFSNDEFLKIPQYYFNERGKKEYDEKIKEILDKKVKPNEIHKIIFELNPQHIVTTNYDNLLEQQEKCQKAKKYSKVSNNKELASAFNSNFILKMHGEFNDIVLKEADYDSYSNNFKLIETYIRGLFTTHTVLFIGFSAEDSNIRKIRQWIRDILGEEHQPAYLLDVDDHKNTNEEEFRIKTEYFKKQGIYRLYYSQIEDEIDITYNSQKDKIDLKGIGLKLYKFLYFIQNYNNQDIDKYYFDLKQLDCLNVITRDVLQKVFGTDIIIRMHSGAFIFETPEKTHEIDLIRIKKVLSQTDKQIENIDYLYENSLLNDNEKKFIVELKRNSNSSLNTLKALTEEEKQKLNNIVQNLSEKYPLIENEEHKISYIFKIIDLAQKAEQSALSVNGFNDELMHYNFKNIKTVNSKENTFDIFKEAYFLYKKNDLVNAFKNLDLISFNYSDNPFIYYISEFNKKILSRSIKSNSFFSATEEEKLIAREYEKIDLELIKKDKIPLSLKNASECFTIESISKFALNMIKSCEKIQQVKDTIENGGSSMDSNINVLYTDFFKFWNFTTHNFLFIDNYIEIQDIYFNFVKALLTSYSIDESKNNGGRDFKTNKAPFFDYFDLYIIVEHMKSKDFQQLVNRYEIKEIKLDNPKTKKELLDAYYNLIDSVLDLKIDSKISNKIENFLTIFSLIDLTYKEIESITNKFITFSKNYNLKTNSFFNFRNHKHKMLKDFIVTIHNKYLNTNKKFKPQAIEKIINEYKAEMSSIDRNYFSLIRNCLYIIQSVSKKKYKLENQEIITFYIAERYRIGHAYEILILMYSLADKNNQNIIKKILKDRYKTLSADIISEFYSSVNEGVIQLTINSENEILNIINKSILDKTNNPTSPESLPSEIIILGETVLNLMIIEKWHQIDKIFELVDKYYEISNKFLADSNKFYAKETARLLELYISPEKFDYKTAKIDDFRYLNKTKRKEIRALINKDSEIKKTIMKKFESEIFFNKENRDSAKLTEFFLYLIT